MSRVQALIFTVTDLRADQGCGAQPHWMLGCRGHPPGGGARRDRGSSWTGGQPKGYWKTVALMGSALERKRRTENESGVQPRPWLGHLPQLTLPTTPAVGRASCLYSLSGRRSLKHMQTL